MSRREGGRGWGEGNVLDAIQVDAVNKMFGLCLGLSYFHINYLFLTRGKANDVSNKIITKWYFREKK